MPSRFPWTLPSSLMNGKEPKRRFFAGVVAACVPLMLHSVRVAVQSGHRYVLGACDDGLLGMYREMGFEVLEARVAEPKPGWRFRSHLLYADAEQLLRDEPASATVAARASAIAFAGLPVAA